MGRRVTLTFDNGPEPDVTPRVLDLLREHELRAHFFVLGKHLATPEGFRLAARARAEGHVLGNHSYTHQTPLGQDPRPDAVEQEIVATAALLAPLLDPGETKRFRPFGGGGVLGKHLLSARALAHLVANAYSCVLWNSVPRDWVDPGGWAARALDDCERLEHTVLVLHDTAEACLSALPGFLQEARSRNFEFTTDLPVECVPLEAGRARGTLEDLVGEPA